MSSPSFAYEGVGYRGLKLNGNAELQRKYADYQQEFIVGQLMTFPAFMSVSTNDKVADEFGDFVFFVFVKVRGARIARLSQLPKEAEILVPPPSVFRIKAVSKFGGRLSITLEQEHCPLTYLSQTAPKSSVEHVASGGSAAVVAAKVPASHGLVSHVPAIPSTHSLAHLSAPDVALIVRFAGDLHCAAR